MVVVTHQSRVRLMTVDFLNDVGTPRVERPQLAVIPRDSHVLTEVQAGRDDDTRQPSTLPDALHLYILLILVRRRLRWHTRKSTNTSSLTLVRIAPRRGRKTPDESAAPQKIAEIVHDVATGQLKSGAVQVQTVAR